MNTIIEKRYIGLENGRRYLNINELSNYIGIPKGTLYVWVCQKRIPYAKIGGLLRFDSHQIDHWIKIRSVAEFN